jgi:hypothetical protein
MPARERRRLIRPTTEHLDHFTWLERDWGRRATDAVSDPATCRRSDHQAQWRCSLAMCDYSTCGLSDRLSL